ncbi:hypothetical protein AHiyo6_05090 [Arthrobacter sp. Hiyo6]|nr:hypothetical protein AHiyo6_05090 [Arthrobacter sp. Hiyo6]
MFTNSQTIDVFVVNASGFAATDLAVVNTASSAPTAGTGIRVTSGDGTHLTRVRTAGFWNNISFEQSEYPTITDLHVHRPRELWVVAAEHGHPRRRGHVRTRQRLSVLRLREPHRRRYPMGNQVAA